MIDLTDHLGVCFSTDAFAKSATYTHGLNAPVTIPVIFDNGYMVGAPVGGVEGIGTSSPSALCRTNDVPSAAANDTLAIDGVTYYVIAAQPDGEGVTTLILSKDGL